MYSTVFFPKHSQKNSKCLSDAFCLLRGINLSSKKQKIQKLYKHQKYSQCHGKVEKVNEGSKECKTEVEIAWQRWRLLRKKNLRYSWGRRCDFDRCSLYRRRVLHSGAIEMRAHRGNWKAVKGGDVPTPTLGESTGQVN